MFEKGFPSFWDDNGKLLLKDDYDAFLFEVRMNHEKIHGMKKGLKEEIIVNKLSHYFDILAKFQVIKKTLPPMSYSSCVELEVLSREMEHYEFPSQDLWMQVERFHNMK